MTSDTTSRPAARTTPILGTPVSILNLDTTLAAVTAALASGRTGYIAVTGVHGITEALDNPALRAALNGAFLVTPDGMPLVWIGRLRGHRDMDRVYGPDLMLLLMDRGRAHGWRHFLAGGKPGIADALAARMREQFPGLDLAGTWTPPFGPWPEPVRTSFLETIRQLKPDLIWIGLSTPKQELLMADLAPTLSRGIMIGTGAAFDFHAGAVRQAPRWMQRTGLEWLFRACSEPLRLGPRYARMIPRFLWHWAREQFKPPERQPPHEIKRG